jgi:phosphoglycolate phosphatase
MTPLAPLLLLAAHAAPADRVPLAPVALRLPTLHEHPASRHQLTVKFRDEARARAGQGRLEILGASCEAATALFAQERLAVRPLVRIPADRLAALEARAAERSGRAAPDLGGMLEVQTDHEGAALLELARRLQALPSVEYAHLAATLPPPPEDLSPSTPDYTDEQGYLGPDPGIGATLAHAEGVRGERVRLSDCEYGWVLEHEDLVDGDIELEPGHSIHPETVANGWDGTVMDSTGRIVSCMQLAALDLELPSLADPVVCSIIGLGLPEAIATLYPQLDDAGIVAMRDRYAFHFIAAEQTPSALYPGAEQVLTHLRESGFKLAVATGKSRKGLQRVWGNTGLDRYFHASRCADESQSKPHPAMVLELLEAMAVPPERAVVVGDTTFDLEMARAAGVDRIGVSYGAHPVEQLLPCEPLAVIDRLDHLLPLVGLAASEFVMESV